MMVQMGFHGTIPHVLGGTVVWDGNTGLNKEEVQMGFQGTIPHVLDGTVGRMEGKCIPMAILDIPLIVPTRPYKLLVFLLKLFPLNLWPRTVLSEISPDQKFSYSNLATPTNTVNRAHSVLKIIHYKIVHVIIFS